MTINDVIGIKVDATENAMDEIREDILFNLDSIIKESAKAKGRRKRSHAAFRFIVQDVIDRLYQLKNNYKRFDSHYANLLLLKSILEERKEK